MDVVVSGFAVLVALGCFIAIYMATRKDNKKDEIKWIFQVPYENAFPGKSHYHRNEKLHDSQFLVLCNHCDSPPCVRACPTKATFKRKDGIVAMDYHRCIGCRFCMAACPYSIRVFNWEEPKQGETSEITMHTGHDGPHPEFAGMPSLKGTPDKCDFCPHTIKKGELPHCVTACPNGVFYFGDKYEDTVTNGEETLRLSKLLEDKAGYRILEELGTEPSVYYLPPVDRLVDFEDGLENYNEFQSVDKPDLE